MIPCAVGDKPGKWQKGQRLYEETIRRAKLALEQGLKEKLVCRGLVVAGGIGFKFPERIAAYSAGIKQMIGDLRADLGIPKLPSLPLPSVN